MKDKERKKKSVLKCSVKGKEARRAARRKRKGYDDKKVQSEGIMYSSGAFDNDTTSNNEKLCSKKK